MYYKYFLIMLFLAIVIQRLLETYSRREKKKGKIRQKWTLSLYTVGHIIVGTGTILEFLLLKRDINYIVTFVGITLYVCGLIGRNWAIKTLDKYWSIHIEIRNNHKLIKTGPYKYMRHPAYFSIILEIWGVPLIMNAYFTFIFAVAAYIPITLIRIYYEEKEHRKLFGPEYLAYKSEVGMFSLKKKLNKKY